MNGFDQLRSDLGRALANRDALSHHLINVTVECPDFEPSTVYGASQETYRVLWHQPEAGFAMVGIGVAERHEAHGRARFDLLSQARRHALASQPPRAPEAPLAFPAAFAGLSFSSTRGEDRLPLPDGLLLVPRLLFVRQSSGPSLLSVTLPALAGEAEAEAAVREAETLLRQEQETGPIETASTELELTEDIDVDTWSAGVLETLDAIEQSQVEKVVLARTVSATAPASFPIPSILRALASRYDHCTVFAYALGDVCFLGATPERLLKLENGRAQVDCLAGSITIGENDCDSHELARRLLADPKERHEHAVVVNAIDAALRPTCTNIEMPSQPDIKGTADVQHLHTPVTATVRPGADLFEVVESLHPTPAMGGHPRGAALPLLVRIEDFDRGWYAGPLGWVDSAGDGEFVVGIRSALVEGNHATLFAGAGIVEGSDPRREFDETNLKLQAMLWALRQK